MQEQPSERFDIRPVDFFRSSFGHPRLPIRLMVSPLYLKSSFNLSDEELVVRWCENIL